MRTVVVCTSRVTSARSMRKASARLLGARGGQWPRSQVHDRIYVVWSQIVRALCSGSGGVAFGRRASPLTHYA